MIQFKQHPLTGVYHLITINSSPRGGLLDAAPSLLNPLYHPHNRTFEYSFHTLVQSDPYALQVGVDGFAYWELGGASN
jgi:hypothetical protein